MRKIFNFNTKWAFTKDAETVPSVMPQNGIGLTYLILGMI